MIGLDCRKAGVRRRPSLRLVHCQVVPIRAVVGLSSDPGWVDRRVLRACLVGSRAVVSQRRRCGAIDSHPEGESSAALVVPSYLGVAPVVGQVAELALLLPTGPRHLPCQLLLLLQGVCSSLAWYSIRVIVDSVANLPMVWGLPSSHLRGCTPGRQTPSCTGIRQILSSRWRCSLSQRARYSSRSWRSRCSSSVRACKSGRRWPGWVRNSSRFRLAWTLAMSSPSVGWPKWKGGSPVCCKEVLHVFPGSSVLPACPGLDVRSSKLPCFDSFWTEDVSVDLLECIPLVVWPLRVEGVCCAAMIEARNGFHEHNASGVGSSLSSSLLIGLVGAVTGVGLVRPLSEWDRRDSVPSRGREGYVVLPKSSKRGH